jgi:hypothetical protein
MSWEKLIASFPLIRHRPHRKRRYQQFVFVEGTSLSSCYLATVVDTQTDPQAHVSNNSSILACICCHSNVFTELLPSNGRGIHRQTHRYSRPTVLLFLHVFVAAGTYLPGRYLASIGNTQTDPQAYTSNNSFILACIHRRGNMFTEPLPSNRKDTLYRGFA